MQTAEEMFSDDFLPTFHLSLSADSWSRLEDEPKEYVEGAFQYGDVSLDRVGIRLKGNATLRTLDQKPAFKIKFDKYEGAQDFLGLKEMTLNNLEQDPTMIRERLSYQVFRAAGIPASRTGFAKVMLNDEHIGLYLNVETVNSEFLAFNFDDASGALYEGDYGDDLKAGHVWRFDLEEGHDANRQDLRELIQWIQQDDDSVFYDADTLLDTQQFLVYSAAEAVLGHYDGYWVSHNYRIYHEPTEGKWSFLPWGMDKTLRKRTEPFDPRGHVTKACFKSARCLADYVEQTRSMLTMFEGLDLEDEVAQIRVLIDDAALEDTRKSASNASMASNRARLLDFVRGRPAEMREWLDCTDESGELDRDGDGYGACFQDCNDDMGAVHPDASEVCDGVDNNCSGNVDDVLECGCPQALVNGETFLLCDLDMGWRAASGWCESLGGTLARIDNAAQNQALWELTQSTNPGGWWIGLSDTDRDAGDWIWVDGEPMAFAPWAEGQPNFDGDEHCVHLRVSQATWDDLACGHKRPFLCRLPSLAEPWETRQVLPRLSPILPVVKVARRSVTSDVDPVMVLPVQAAPMTRPDASK